MNITMKDCIKLAVTLLSIEELPEEVFAENAEISDSQQKLLDILTSCGNLVYSEMAAEFMPVSFCETVTTADGVIPFSALSKRCIDVIEVKKDKTKLAFSLKNNALVTGSGEITVTYTYLPEKIPFEGVFDYSYGRLSDRVLALGVAAEYCLISGQYADALVFDKRYKDSLIALSRKKNYRIPARRWA